MRSALLTPLNLGLIWVEEDIAREVWSRHEPVILERRDILYGSLVQCGISKFECLAVPESSMPVAEFLRKRITTPGKSGSKYGTCLFMVNQAFEKHLGKGFHRHPQPAKVNTLFLFVGDLLYSLHRRKSMVSFLRFDELVSTIETLPPELRIPLRNLWALMRSAEPELPVPRQEISARDVAQFEQILASTGFTEYENRSSELDTASLPESDCISAAEHAAQGLVRANGRLLNAGSTPDAITEPHDKGN